MTAVTRSKRVSRCFVSNKAFEATFAYILTDADGLEGNISVRLRNKAKVQQLPAVPYSGLKQYSLSKTCKSSQNFTCVD